MVRLFLQGTGMEKVELVELEASDPLDVVVERAQDLGVHGGDEVEVFLEDHDEPLERGRTVAELGLSDHDCVHVGRCHRVSVTVRYGGPAKQRDFSPAQRAKHVLMWAKGKNGFNVSASDGLDFGLQVCGHEGTIDVENHVGTFVTGEGCEVCFDLIPPPRIQG